jgi:hypothetical protein
MVGLDPHPGPAEPDRVRVSVIGRGWEETTMSVTMILLIVLILLLVGALPAWPHSRGWGYAPSGLLGTALIVLLILLLLGYL